MKIICISWPKAGTHVLYELSRIVLGSKSWQVERDVKYSIYGDHAFFQDIDERIAKYNDNFAIKSHVCYSKNIEKGLLNRGFKILFIIRDPRDIICSTLRWLVDLRKDWEISRYILTIPGEQRIAKIITGLPPLKPFDLDANIIWDKPLHVRYQSITPWAYSKNVFTSTFENLTGKNGKNIQEENIRNILDYLGLKTSDYLSLITDQMINPEANTYHSGGSKTWLDIFSQEDKDLFISSGTEGMVNEFNYPSTKVSSYW